jgi:predicted NUDIX family NTP pyrophosphohydrolase
MPKTSAGLLMYRRRPAGLEILLVHPGGPYYAKKNDGAWSVPKGQAEEGEELLAAAQREFTEETGFKPTGPFTEFSRSSSGAGRSPMPGLSSTVGFPNFLF